MNVSDELYQEVILDHSRRPRNFGCPRSHTHQAEGDNPLCGDRYKVYLQLDAEGVIREAAFDGAGCAISKASASLMTQALEGRHYDEIEGLFCAFHDLVQGRGEDVDPQTLGKLAVFSGIWKYPSRVKCAILCWHAVRSALSQPVPESPPPPV